MRLHIFLVVPWLPNLSAAAALFFHLLHLSVWLGVVYAWVHLCVSASGQNYSWLACHRLLVRTLDFTVIVILILLWCCNTAHVDWSQWQGAGSQVPQWSQSHRVRQPRPDSQVVGRQNFCLSVTSRRLFLFIFFTLLMPVLYTGCMVETVESDFENISCPACWMLQRICWCFWWTEWCCIWKYCYWWYLSLWDGIVVVYGWSIILTVFVTRCLQ